MEENKKCKYCQSEINKKAKICPYCRKGQKNPIFMGITLGIGCCFGAVLIAFALHTLGNFIPNVENESKLNNEIVEVIEEQEEKTEEMPEEIQDFSLSKETVGYNEGNAFYIVGGIRNNFDKQYSYVQVTFNLYNKDGAQIGTAMDNINNLEPNGIWKFKAIGIVSEPVDTYKITGITGW